MALSREKPEMRLHHPRMQRTDSTMRKKYPTQNTSSSEVEKFWFRPIRVSPWNWGGSYFP